MEETLGKRIMGYRKGLGLTQDQLAERLGVSAQAVSKWENDQSCPDITTLPRLAEIFGVSIDALLGHTPEKVYTGEVVTGTKEGNGWHIHFGDEDADEEQEEPEGWHLSFDSGRHHAVGFAVLVLLVGGLMLCAALLEWEVTFWNILWPSALLVLGVFGLYPKFSFFSLGCTVFGGYFLLDNLHALPWSLGGKNLLMPVILVLFGLSLLADALRKPRKPQFHYYRNGKRGKPSYDFNTTDDSFAYSATFSQRTERVEMKQLSRGEISVSFGEYTIDLSGVESVSSSCRIEANSSFGELTLRVPGRYSVRCDTSTAFGNFEVHGHPDPDSVGIITLEGSVNFGELTVEYM